MFPMLLKEERSSFHGNNDSHSINSNGYSTDAARRRTSVLMVKTGRKKKMKMAKVINGDEGAG